MYLVATLDPVMLFKAINDSGSSYTPMSSALWVASYKHTSNITMCMYKKHSTHLYMYISLTVTINVFLLDISSVLLGKLAALCSRCLLQIWTRTWTNTDMGTNTDVGMDMDMDTDTYTRHGHTVLYMYEKEAM
jgi:hypothetical protein